MFFNPFDISEDGKNDFIDGIKYHLRESDLCKDKIKNFIKRNSFEYFCLYDMPAWEVLEDAMRSLKIKDNSLTVADEHELLDWITCQIK